MAMKSSDVVKTGHTLAKHAHLRMAVQVDNRSRLLSDLQLEKRLSEETHLDDETLYESQTAEDHMAGSEVCPTIIVTLTVPLWTRMFSFSFRDLPRCSTVKH